MRVVIAGSRSLWVDNQEMNEIVAASGFTITEVVSGNARGPDRCGENWGYDNGIPVKLFLPDWTNYGKAAGPMRNQEMAKYASALIAIYDGKSPGTKNMIATMRRLGKPVYVHRMGLKMVPA